jgi:hypothetical protein
MARPSAPAPSSNHPTRPTPSTAHNSSLVASFTTCCVAPTLYLLSLLSSFARTAFSIIRSLGISVPSRARSAAVIALVLCIVTMLAFTSSMRVLGRPIGPTSKLFGSRSAVNSRGGSQLFSTIPASDLKMRPPVLHDAFTVKDDQFVDEFGIKTTLYTHKKTGTYNKHTESISLTILI